ncbi:hypothetical protein AXE80_13470 [Wenyingzhuangia fucanilytica]|uniref:Uncharacterized protein n=1 Tax=Wenyingzhuangia fucanilytica TaxID=1790137 RepID=A0A1B1Y937_9FLAO|nr:hypothetical protein [Wenyingzhuangia fucanilytica]ANW97238.1 hypothetical protein AXE80_13470 [Wenyingzhuangia fucanilytica]
MAQKIINNPDCVANNISGSVTKIELTDKETILHLHIRGNLGGWIAIPKETYIENSGDGEKRLYITKTEGITLTGRNYFTNSDEKRFKLYFPPLPKEIKQINYGESNVGGNWFIYKLDLTKDGKNFITKNNKPFVIGNPMPDKITITKTNNKNLDIKTLNTSDLPKDFFGNWYDKYGTLLMITTPDYIVSDNRIKYYLNIEKIGTHKYKILTTSNAIEILSLDDETITIRTNRLLSLHKKKNKQKVPDFIKGKWTHWDGVKEITITDDYFYNNDKDYHGAYRETIKNKIDWIASSDNKEIFWFVLYHQGDYNIYFIKKINDEYVLQPRGFADAKYIKN